MSERRSNRRSFSAATGYDYPPASESTDLNPTYDFDAIPTTLRSLRERVANIGREPPHMSSPSPPSDSRRRMRSVLRRIRENERNPPSELALPPTSPRGGTMAPPSRRRAQPSERFQRLNDQRTRRLQNMGSSDYEGLVELQEASERLAQTNEDLRTLLERPLDSRSVPSVRSRTSRFLEADDLIHSSESQHRRKRRRVEGPGPSSADLLQPVEYGVRGQNQIHPCPLNMEVRHSNTGDTSLPYDISDHRTALEEPTVKHILRDDPNVYFANSRRANIVLQHPGERLFTLDRIIIKTPECSNSDARLQGLVFASREMDKTLERTIHDHVHHLATCLFGPRPTHGSSTSHCTLRVAEEDDNQFSEFPPSHGSRYHPIQRPPRVSADCDADSGVSESDDSNDTLRPRNMVVSRDTWSVPLLSDLDSSDTDVEEESLSRSLGSRRHNGQHHSPFPQLPRPDEDSTFPQSGSLNFEDDDFDNMVAQFDFDEVLRRGAVTAADRRRRRAATRERVQRQRSQWRSEADSRESRPTSATALLSELNNSSRVRSSDSTAPGPLQPIEPPVRAREIPPILEANRLRLPEPSPPPQSPDMNDLAAVDPTHLLSENDFLDPFAFLDYKPDDRPRRCRYAFCAGSSGSVSRTAPPPSDQTGPEPELSLSLQPGFNAVRVTNSYVTRESGGRTSIKFDPPISTRYVLLKLWKCRRSASPRARGNSMKDQVELTRVRVEGWCGVRCFPAVEMA